MMRFLLVCLGGAVGTGARYLLSLFFAARHPGIFPMATLVVNTSGSLLLGVVAYVGSSSDLLSPTARFALAAGVLGGFTTYSTFNHETLQMINAGSWRMAVANVTITVVLGLLAGMAGLAIGKAIAG